MRVLPEKVAEAIKEARENIDCHEGLEFVDGFPISVLETLICHIEQPQPTDAQRQAAMRTFDDGFDSYETREYADNGPDTGKAEGQLYFFWPEQVQQIKAALQSPAVPREVVDILEELACLGAGQGMWGNSDGNRLAQKALALLGLKKPVDRPENLK